MLNIYLTQSAGNLLNLEFLGVFKDYMQKFIWSIVLDVGIKKVFPNLYIIFRKKHYRSHTSISGNFNTEFAHYIAGLTGRDDSIMVLRNERSVERKLNYPSIEIVFQLKDLPLAFLIQKELGHGSIS